MAVYFSIFLVVLTVITGIVWVLDWVYLAPKRKENIVVETLTEEEIKKQTEASFLVDTAVQIFPVIAFVLILRSFIFEPFQIPSGSMMPTLLDGDFILVNKFNYGLRDPVARHKFVEIGLPERGDIVVFKYPLDERIDFIKRVIGLPGDRIIYRNKSIYIKPSCENDAQKCGSFEQVAKVFKEKGQYFDGQFPLTRYEEALPGQTHDILVNDAILPRTAIYYPQPGSQKDEFIVPQGQYFVMGDNRDNSQDGRFWGFVPEENLVGQAFAIWMSFDFEREPADWLPTWIPTGVRFERLGGLN